MVFDSENNTTQTFNENFKLINNTINGLFIDDESNAWLSTNKGISSINPSK